VSITWSYLAWGSEPNIVELARANQDSHILLMTVMDITAELSMDLDPILLTTQSKSCLLVLCRGGVRGKSPHCSLVQGWFLILMDFNRCDAHWSNLDNSDAGRRAHRHTEALFEAVGIKSLWDDYGIISDILVCQSLFLF
jgi:hypothetical protein